MSEAFTLARETHLGRDTTATKMGNPAVSCRTGPLRVGRALRAFSTWGVSAPVGRK